MPDVKEQIQAALDELSALYSIDTVRWYAELWDPAIGGFYYSNSARDYEGFLPDIESTVQLLRIVENLGMLEGRTLREALPADVCDKLLRFVCSLQDEDGYFYHPQWGKDITTSRRGRDLSWSVSLLQTLGAKPPYPTAVERLANKAADNGAQLPAHLLDRTSFVRYLEELDIPHRSYPAANSLNAQVGQIRAAGLLDVCCDYLDAIQNKDNGLWQEGVNYYTVSGLLKVTAVYAAADRTPPLWKRSVQSAIEAALCTAPADAIVSVYNPICSLNSLLNTERRLGHTDAVQYIRQAVDAHALDMIRMTKEKVLPFRKADGSYSYFPTRTSHTSQGAPVARKNCNEGDVNATSITLNGILGGVTRLMGYPFLPFDGTVFDEFLAILQARTAPKKRPNAAIDA